MPTNSPNFNIPKPVASDAFNLTNFNAILDAIDTNIKTALTGVGDVAKDISSTDLNVLDTTGFYRGTSLTNNPTGVTTTWFYIINVKHSTLYKVQIAFTFGSSGFTYIRHNNNGTWTAWTQVATYDATGKVAVANLPSATTSAAGISQLADSISDTSTTKAATANSVKLAIDWVRGFGIGLTSKDYNLDLDVLKTNGLYYAQSAASNKPGGANGYVIVQTNLDTSYASQFFITTAGLVYCRVSIAGTWNAWTQVETTTGAQTKASTAETNAINFAKGFGLGDIAKDIGGTDLNNLDATGFYKGSTLTNSPDGSVASFFVINMKSQATHKTQFAFKYGVSSNESYQRVNNGGTWTAWQKNVIDQKTAWTNLTLQNSWANIGAPYPTASYRKNADGTISLRGMVGGGAVTSGTVIANLPAGYRPTHTRRYLVSSYNGSLYAEGVIQILSNGDIVILNGSNTQISLDNVEAMAID